ncbi:MAG: hypothetical protein ACXW18_03155 [Pyrinomonadaceae bacterium]
MIWRLFSVAVIILNLMAAGCRTRPPAGQSSPAMTQPSVEAAREPLVEKPSLSGKIQNLSMYPVPNRRDDLAVSLVVSVINKGSPGFAQDWKLEVNSPGRDDLKNLEPVHVNGLVEIPGQRIKVDLGKEDLAIKSKQSLLAKGDQLDGVLTFVLPRTATEDLANNRSSFTLHFKDSLGSSYQTPKSVIGTKVGK